MKYIGWIPTSSGHLSFTNIQGKVIPGRCTVSPERTYDEQHPGKISIQCERTLEDKPLANFLRSLGIRTGQSFIFQCRAEVSQEKDALIGKVIGYPSISKRGAEDFFKKEENCKTGIHKDHACWIIDFELARNGTIEITWGNANHRDVTTIFEDSDTEEKQKIAIDLLTFESFSFLKDIIHSHKFHSIEDDSIVVTYRQNSEISWQDETAKNLHRAIISSVRNKPARLGLINAQGKIAYLRSLIRISKSEFCNKLDKSVDNLERTIETQIARENLASEASNNIKTILLAAFTSIIATIFALVQLLQLPCISELSAAKDVKECGTVFHVPGTVVSFAAGLLANLDKDAIYIFIAFLIMAYMFCRRNVLELYSDTAGSETVFWHFVRFFYGLSLTRGKYMAAFWLTALFGITIFLIAEAAFKFI